MIEELEREYYFFSKETQIEKPLVSSKRRKLQGQDLENRMKEIKNFFRYDRFVLQPKKGLKNNLSDINDLASIVRKTNRLDEIGHDKKVTIKFLIKNIPEEQLCIDFLSDKKGNNLLFFAVKEDDFSLFDKMLACAGPHGTKCSYDTWIRARRNAVEQKNSFGTSVLDVVRYMKKSKKKEFLKLLEWYGVLDAQVEEKLWAVKKLNKSTSSE